MPRVTNYGDVLAGNGAAVSVNQAPIATIGTVACFLDPSRVIYQRQVNPAPHERWKLEVYDLATQQFSDVPYGDRGANFLAARGGRWIAYTAGIGVYDATGSIWPTAGLAATGTDGRGAIGQDGTIGFVQHRDAGAGLQLLMPTGEAIDLPDSAIQTLSIVDCSLAVWVEGGQVRAWSAQGVPQPAAQAEPAAAARVVLAGSQRFLLVTTNERLILRRWDLPTGKVIVMTWGPGQKTALHDHAGIWCVECVVEGNMEVSQYDLTSDTGDAFRFEQRNHVVAGRGSAGCLIPPFEYHTLGNAAATPSVTLHVYGGEMDHCHVFEPSGDGSYRRVRRELSYHE